ncbi:MAG: hypothetical protein ABI947_07205 [Chloroflexota bacterium]
MSDIDEVNPQDEAKPSGSQWMLIIGAIVIIAIVTIVILVVLQPINTGVFSNIIPNL